MLPQQLPDSLKRILKMSLILTFVSTIAIFAFGFGMQSVHQEINSLNGFMREAESVQPNFEKSLVLYTERTKDVIDYLLSLRPSGEEEFVNFISEIETIAQKLNLQINLDSLEGSLNDNKAQFKSISYGISFYGDMDRLNKFLVELEKLDYFIKIGDLEFKELSLIKDREDKKNENIGMNITLFIK